jgi:integrase
MECKTIWGGLEMAKKRANGEGSIYKRKDGTWAAQASIAGQKVYFYGKTQGEVKDKLANALELARKGLYSKPTKQTFGEWLDLWLKEYSKPVIRPTTYVSYESLIRRHIKPCLGNIPLKDLQPSQIQKFYNRKLKEGLIDRRSEKTKRKQADKNRESSQEKPATISARTVHYMHILISQSLEQALKENKIFRNPAKATKPPKTEKKEARFLTPEQLTKFFESISAERWYPAFMIDLNTGMRLGELCALKWTNVDLEKGVITVKEAVSRIKSGNGWVLYFHQPKSKKGLRVIPLPVQAVEVLKKLRARQAAEELKLKITGKYHDDGFVFTWEDGRMVEPNYLSKRFLKLIREHNLSVNFHGLRHSYASALLKANVHPKVVQELLGDSTISVVLDTYSHVLPGLKERAANKLDDLFAIKNPPLAEEG